MKRSVKLRTKFCFERVVMLELFGARIGLLFLFLIMACQVIAIDVVKPAAELLQQENKKTVVGIVRDEAGESLPGVSVMVKGTTTGTITDVDGKYRLQIPKESVALVFSYVGMQTQEVKIANKTQLNVTMLTNTEILDEVVVTGYQTIDKERATGSFSVLSQKNLKGKLQTNIISRMEGLAAGLVKVNNSGDIAIRGISTINADKKPLYVVDGMPYEGDLNSINPSDITNVTVLKDATAASIYGARAANGVIVITTRKGAGDGKTKVSYNGSVRFDPIPDMGYLNLTNSSELVDLQVAGFDFYHSPYDKLNKRQALNPIMDLLYKKEQNIISDADYNSQINKYRQLDNRQQIEDELVRVGVVHQHDLSVSGGNDKNRYIVSINYMGDYGNQKYQGVDRLGFNFRDNINFFKWMSADFGVAGSFTNDKGDDGMGKFSGLYKSGPSYNMLRDESGNPLSWQGQKSQYEIDRLQGLGLLDETYIPVNNRSEETHSNKDNYYRIQGGLNFKIIEGLSVDFKFQTENSSYRNRSLYSEYSKTVASMVNDAAQYDKEAEKLTLNVPTGGQMSESRGDRFSYTMRGQINFDRIFGKHGITAIAGAERRLVRATSTTNYYMGYDDNSLGYKLIDPLTLSEIGGTEAIYGSYNWAYDEYNYLRHKENRYVSFYANGSYTFNELYSATASVRMDQSNLFGTDPKYQYRPLWSVGGTWHLDKEYFMKNIGWLNRLNLRLTYGIGGNIATDAGPYLTVYEEGYEPWVGDVSSSIGNPPNDQLRWEKTSTTNVGLDFTVLNNRLSGSFDFYNKKTTDLLGDKNSDPTLGWDQLTINYGSLYNRGVEVALNSINIQNRKFTWGTNFIFSYNKNKLTNLEGTKESVFNYTAYDVTAVGYPVNALFSYKYAGLDPENGRALAYDSEGNKVSNVTSAKDLVYSGTRTPKYSASLTNRFSYAGFDLSFMFIYYGGHVIRNAVSPIMSGAPGANIDRQALTFWQNPGDENIAGMVPAMNRSIGYKEEQVWYAADVHVLKADYIKLRDISLTYNLPKKLIRKSGMESVAVTCQINNLWKWTANDKNVDPEAFQVGTYGRGSRTLPIPTTYSLGLSVNF